MRSLLNQLHSSESLLLMYLADELPAVDRAEVEQRLARDANLRAELEGLRDVQAHVNDAIAALDAAQPLPGSEAAGARQVARAIRQWRTDHAARPARDAIPPRTLRFPYWSYPLAAAAAVTIAFATWWYTSPEPGRLGPENNIVMNETGAELPVEPGDVTVDPMQIASLDVFADTKDLSALEDELQDLRALSDVLQ